MRRGPSPDKDADKGDFLKTLFASCRAQLVGLNLPLESFWVVFMSVRRVLRTHRQINAAYTCIATNLCILLDQLAVSLGMQCSYSVVKVLYVTHEVSISGVLSTTRIALVVN